MSMDSGPNPESPLYPLPLSDPRCRNDTCLAYYNGHQLSQKDISWASQFLYGQWLTWYYLVLIGICMALYAVQLWSARRTGSSKTSPNVSNKIIAIVRSISYRRLPSRFGLPSVGVLLVLFLSILLLCIATFTLRPYYRLFRGFGSPPLAVRTGLMAQACTPLLVVLAGKVNLITLVTGISHEKLNVFHRWVGWIAFALSVVHTIPFIVQPLREGGYANLRQRFYAPGAYEFTGTPALALLLGLVMFSVPWIRHRFYETFVHSHVVFYVAYLGLLFWHSADELGCWSYLWATLALWLASAAVRVFYKNRNFVNFRGQWLNSSVASLDVLPGNMLKVDIAAPDGMRWTPGQHVFLRFPHFAILDSHPFTIASAYPTHDRICKKALQTPTMTFYLRSHAGLTQRLYEHPSQQSTALTATVDGPYGGIPYKVENVFDHIILVGGGSGITACLPWLEHLTHKLQSDSPMSASSVKLIWAIKSREPYQPILHELDVAAGGVKETSSSVEISVFITGAGSSETDSSTSGQDDIEMQRQLQPDRKEAMGCAIMEPTPMSFHEGRPDLQQLLGGSVTRGKNLIIGCGPQSMKADLSNAVAGLQQKVWDGNGNGNGKGEVVEVKLWTETFGW